MGIHVLLRKEIAKTIRLAILDGEYLPGQRVPVEPFCRKLEVSPTPVQDAMVILEQEGLVTIKPRSGVYVRTFTPEEIVDLLLVEGAIETLAIAKAAKRIHKRELVNLEALHHQFEQTPEPTAKEFRSYDRKFHSAIIKSSRSAILVELLAKQLSQIYLSRFYTATAPGRIAHSLKEHGAILESLRRHDPDRALASLQRHIERAVADFCQNG